MGKSELLPWGDYGKTAANCRRTMVDKHQVYPRAAVGQDGVALTS